MDSKVKGRLVSDLVDKVNEYVENKRLFCGGCCYAASVLADIFTKLGIYYEVVLFQSYDSASERDFNDAINGSCDHVAIEVRLGKERVIIGDYGKISLFYRRYRVRHAIRRYRNITPEMLAIAYADNEWNDAYDICNNRYLKRSLWLVTKKYTEIA